MVPVTTNQSSLKTKNVRSIQHLSLHDPMKTPKKLWSTDISRGQVPWFSIVLLVYSRVSKKHFTGDFPLKPPFIEYVHPKNRQFSHKKHKKNHQNHQLHPAPSSPSYSVVVHLAERPQRIQISGWIPCHGYSDTFPIHTTHYILLDMIWVIQ